MEGVPCDHQAFWKGLVKRVKIRPHRDSEHLLQSYQLGAGDLAPVRRGSDEREGEKARASWTSRAARNRGRAARIALVEAYLRDPG